MASGKIVKFGVVGCGEIANLPHIPEIVRNQKAELIATCDVRHISRLIDGFCRRGKWQVFQSEMKDLCPK